MGLLMSVMNGLCIFIVCLIVIPTILLFLYKCVLPEIVREEVTTAGILRLTVFAFCDRLIDTIYDYLHIGAGQQAQA